MTALAILIPAVIVTLAVVLAAYTPDVDSMADPAPRLGEDDYRHCTGITATWCPIHGDCICPIVQTTFGHHRSLSDASCPLHAPDSPHADNGPHVPPDVMRRIDAALPRRQVNARHLHFVEGERQ